MKKKTQIYISYLVIYISLMLIIIFVLNINNFIINFITLNSIFIAILFADYVKR